MPYDIALISTIAVDLAFAFVGGFIAVRLRSPPFVGYLLAGSAAPQAGLDPRVSGSDFGALMTRRDWR